MRPAYEQIEHGETVLQNPEHAAPGDLGLDSPLSLALKRLWQAQQRLTQTREQLQEQTSRLVSPEVRLDAVPAESVKSEVPLIRELDDLWTVIQAEVDALASLVGRLAV